MYKCLLCPAEAVLCEPHSTLSTTDNVLCVNCSAESRAGLARAGGKL